MAEAPPVLALFLQGVLRATGAESVSLFLPASEHGADDGLLVSAGRRILPELEDASRAEQWHAAQPTPGATGAGRAAPPHRTSSARGGFLFPLRLPSRESGATATGEGWGDGSTVEGWFGVRFDGETCAEDESIEAFLESGAKSHLTRLSAYSLWPWLLEVAAGLLGPWQQVQSLLVDGLTGLPSRQVFEARLPGPMEVVRQNGGRLGLALFNPDDFSAVNRTRGRRTGDEVVREISRRLEAALPTGSLRCRFGGVVFAATFLEIESGEGSDGLETWAKTVLQRLSRDPFLSEDLELRFSCGLTTLSHRPDKEQAHPLELVQRADQSLNAAKLLGGNRLVVWSPELESQQTFDRLSGVFTGNTVRDYRNMAFLWNSIAVLSDDLDADQLLDRLLQRLVETLSPKAALYLETIPGEGSDAPTQRIRSTFGDASDLLPAAGGGKEPRLLPQLTTLLAQARRRTIAATHSNPDEAGEESAGRARWIALRLGSEAEPLGYLVLQADDNAPSWELSDLVFLEAIGPQLALVLRRAESKEREKRELEEDRRRLEAELESLRSALKRSKLLYSSARMQALVETARRAARTDATVLITGPSGTGKELIARTVHELSERRARPMVVVDCGAISTTLIESELFGHERGAYTGAQGARSGRLAEADGSTLFLDEIGELPLDVQAKLLRFVQERQFTVVGGSRTRSVDVRIVAATNRDLRREVELGRFREDLFYRLNVVRIEVPPLAERAEDIELLADHFLDRFAKQYGRPTLSLSAAARRSLLNYSWPGNVRELENRILQAVILAQRTALEPHDLGLAAEHNRAEEDQDPPQTEVLDSEPAVDVPATPQPPALRGEDSPPHQIGEEASVEELLERLSQLLGPMLEDCVRLRRRDPIGRWLHDDLLRQAFLEGGNTMRGAARLLALPEATFRRQWKRLRDEEEHLGENLMASRPPDWSELRSVLSALLQALPDAEHRERPVVQLAEHCLLQQIVRRFPRQVTVGAAFLGVSPPTFRRRIAEMEAQAAAG